MTKWAYLAMVRPIIDYGEVVWIKATERLNSVGKLRKVQRADCMLITSAYPSTPTAAIEMLMDIRPIDLHLKEVAVKASTRLKKTGHWQSERTDPSKGWTKSHSDICNKFHTGIKRLQMPMDLGKRTWLLRKNFAVQILERQEAGEKAQLTRDDTFRCYTDG